MRKLTVYLALVLLGAMLLSGCNPRQALLADPVAEELMVEALEAIKNGDEEGFRILFDKDVLPKGEDFSAAFAQMKEYYGGEIVSWEAVSQTRATYPSQREEPYKTVTIVYDLVTDLDTYRVVVTRVESEGQSRLFRLEIGRSEEYAAAVTPIGYLSDITRFTGLQWTLLLTNILAYGFVLVTVVRCLRDKIRRKPLYIILSLIQITFYKAASPVFSQFNFMFTPMGFASHLVYPNGGTATTVVFPLGALIYWMIRKKRIRRVSQSENDVLTPEIEETLTAE